MATKILPVPTVPRKPFTIYKVLSFDIFGTLIDWESSLHAHLSALNPLLPASSPLHDQSKAIQAFDHQEVIFKHDNPALHYPTILAKAYVAYAREAGIATAQLSDADLRKRADALGSSIGSWNAFPDTIPALKKLRVAGYKLVPVSNIDNASIKVVLQNGFEGFEFDALYTGEDIGSYKPDLHNFEYLFEHAKGDFGVDKEDILHVAHGLGSDHIPAKKIDLASVWVGRPGGAMDLREEAEELVKKGEVGFGWWVDTMGDLVELMEKERL